MTIPPWALSRGACGNIEAAQLVVETLADTDLLEPEVHAELEAERVPFILPLEGDRGTGIERKSFLRSVSNTLSTIADMAGKYIKAVGGRMKIGHMKAWETLGESTTLTLFTIAMTPLSTLAAGYPYFAFLLPIIAFVGQFTDKK
ncbi:hypothetical protein [Asticcacaulis machinosus]|uniref:Uncharacterized protein n=1 Tax=Asticcacaulis machinosus TaxID=2984211 RepID=A0ABT5HFX6_9CAUL|nr:hypothetical protein [Asticcacaulis machinosus]MDC7675169.1 hypothetical protein [Asticcacaulis machinosus]